MPQLDPTWFFSQLFWLAVCFIALYAVLSRLVLPPLQEVLARRAGTVASDLEQAKDLTAKAARAKQDYEQALNEARAKAQDLFNSAIAEQKAKADQSSKAMDARVVAKLATAREKITAEKRELMLGLAPAAEELAGMIVEKLTKQTLGSDSARSVVTEAMKSRR